MSCRSGCRTKDHASYSECLRAASVQTPAVLTSPMSDMYGKTKRDLSAYEAARRQGIQPGGTTVEKVREAEQASRALGRPYNADTDPPANMIKSKTAAKFVNWKE